jgi:superfamily II DNA or RNA helicase
MKLYKHQQQLLELNPKRHGLFFDTGTGKTLTAIKLAEKNSDNCLVLCPKSLKEQWYEEIDKFSERKIDWLVKTKEEFRRDWNLLSKYSCLVYDEFHFWGNHKSQLHKNTMKYCIKHQPEFIYGLTASPYMSSIMNIFALERLLGYTPRWIDYNKKYFYPMKIGRRIIHKQKDGLEKEVARLCNNIGTAVKLEDCIDLPEQIFKTEYFYLTTDQKKAIKNITDLEAIVKFTKTHQICGGTLKSDGYTEDKEFDSEKMKRVIELAHEHRKIVIVCRYNHEIKILRDKLKNILNCVVITGATKDKHHALKDADKAKSCVILTNAACSVGWQVPSFNFMVFYSYSFSLVDAIQMRGRINRINFPSSNIYLSLVVKDTIDEHVYDNIVNKKMDFQIALYNS